MTHNIFGLNYDMKRLAAVIEAEKPDIVALQEYFPAQSELDGLLKPTYPYAVRCQGGKRANLGLYSKIPFDREMSAADCPSDAFGKQRTAHIIAGFTLSDGTHFSVMTTHMDWPFPIERQKDEFEATEHDGGQRGAGTVAGRRRLQLDAVVVRDEGVRGGDRPEARDARAGDLPADDHRAAASVARRAADHWRRSCRSTRCSSAA